MKDAKTLLLDVLAAIPDGEAVASVFAEKGASGIYREWRRERAAVVGRRPVGGLQNEARGLDAFLMA